MGAARSTASSSDVGDVGYVPPHDATRTLSPPPRDGQALSAARDTFKEFLGAEAASGSMTFCKRFVGQNEKPSTKAEVEFAVLQRKILQRGHDPPTLYSCTLQGHGGRADQQVCVALFSVFTPARGTSQRDLQDIHMVPIQYQSGWDSDIVVVDLEGRDSLGIWHRCRLCRGKDWPQIPEAGLLSLLEEAEQLTSVSLASRVADSPDESLSDLMLLLHDMIFSCVGFAQNVRQLKGPMSIPVQPEHNSDGGELFTAALPQNQIKTMAYLSLLMNTDAGYDGSFFEIAWLARSFEIGNAGNLPSGSCGSPVYKFGTQELAGMYSCLTADAPWKCIGHAPAVEPDVLPRCSFVRVERLDLLRMMVRNLESSGKEPQHSETDCEARASWKASFPPNESAELGVDLHECKLERLSDHIYRISDLEVDVQQLRFTQNTISTRFRDGRSVNSLAAELRADASKARDLPKLQVFEHANTFYSLDNRRLFAMKVAGVSRLEVELVQVRRDLLNKRLTTTSCGRVVVFAPDPSIPDLADFRVLLDDCSGSQPNCSHRVEVTHMGCSRPTVQTMTAHEIVKIQAMNRFQIDDHFQSVFMDVMLSLAFPPTTSPVQSRNKQRSKKAKR